MAECACRLTDNNSYACLDALAVARAAVGRFPDAIATAQKAITLARAAGETLPARQIEARLRLYQEGRAYRQPTLPPVPRLP